MCCSGTFLPRQTGKLDQSERLAIRKFVVDWRLWNLSDGFWEVLRTGMTTREVLRQTSAARSARHCGQKKRGPVQAPFC
jgi:hypothetical protein